MTAGQTIVRRAAMMLLLLLADSILLRCQIVHIREVRFAGNRAFTSSQLLESLISRPGTAYSADLVRNDIALLGDRYKSEGMYFTEITPGPLEWSADSLDVTIVYLIDEGARLSVGRVAIEGNSAIPTGALMQSMDTRPGGMLDQVVLEHDIEGIIGAYERIGYPFVNASVAGIGIDPQDSSRLVVEIGIAEGARVAIHEVKIVGNTETTDHVIIRESRIRENELYDGDKVAQIPRRLNRLNIFSSVREPEVFVNDAGGGLLLRVEEGKTNTFDGILGYIPTGVNGTGGYVTGLIHVGMRNLFGTARRVQIRWQRDDNASQEVAAAYTEPWLFDLPVHVSIGFFQRQQDSSFVRRSFDLRGEMSLFDAFSLTGSLNWEEIVPSGTIAVPTVAHSRKFLAGLELVYDTRDDIVSPRGGVRYRATYENGSKRIDAPLPTAPDAPQRSTVQRIGIDAEFYFEVFSRQVVKLGMAGRQITTDYLESGDYYRFGGATTLRGYRENQFQGGSVAWTNAEYRFLLAPRSYLFGFFDTGFYFIPADEKTGTPSSEEFLFGYGAGFRLDTSLGNIGVSIAMGKGDSPSEAKLHLVLLNDF